MLLGGIRAATRRKKRSPARIYTHQRAKLRIQRKMGIESRRKKERRGEQCAKETRVYNMYRVREGVYIYTERSDNGKGKKKLEIIKEGRISWTIKLRTIGERSAVYSISG